MYICMHHDFLFIYRLKVIKALKRGKIWASCTYYFSESREHEDKMKCNCSLVGIVGI